MGKKVYHIVKSMSGALGVPSTCSREVQDIPNKKQAESLLRFYQANANKGEVFWYDFDWR